MAGDKGIEDVVNEITTALRALRHERWQLSALHDGRLWVIADSQRLARRPGARCTRISSLARACLLDRCPITVNNVLAPEAGEPLRDWELDWPSLVYVPVASRVGRAVGVLLVGAKTLETYSAADLRFLGDLGQVVAPWLRRYLADNAETFGRRAA